MLLDIEYFKKKTEKPAYSNVQCLIKTMRNFFEKSVLVISYD